MQSCEPTTRKVDCVAEKVWQVNQSNVTKSKNLENDWDVLTASAKEFGLEKMKGPSRFVNDKVHVRGDCSANRPKQRSCSGSLV